MAFIQSNPTPEQKGRFKAYAAKSRITLQRLIIKALEHYLREFPEGAPKLNKEQKNE